MATMTGQAAGPSSCNDLDFYTSCSPVLMSASVCRELPIPPAAWETLAVLTGQPSKGGLQKAEGEGPFPAYPWRCQSRLSHCSGDLPPDLSMLVTVSL